MVGTHTRYRTRHVRLTHRTVTYGHYFLQLHVVSLQRDTHRTGTRHLDVLRFVTHVRHGQYRPLRSLDTELTVIIRNGTVGCTLHNDVGADNRIGIIFGHHHTRHCHLLRHHLQRSHHQQGEKTEFLFHVILSCCLLYGFFV